jgi:uncharacterized protein (TIGR02265 family)
VNALEPFGLPRFDADLDVDAYLARVPSDACCKGMFFGDLLSAARSVSEHATVEVMRELGSRRYIAFKDYPLREHMKLSSRLVPRLFPAVPTREGMRRLGWLVYPLFKESLIGRVVFGVLGHDLDQVMKVGPRSFELSLTRGRAKAERLGEGHYRYHFEEIYGFLDSYYVGVLEGVFRSHDVPCEVRIALRTPSDGAMDIRWHEPPGDPR